MRAAAPVLLYIIVAVLAPSAAAAADMGRGFSSTSTHIAAKSESMPPAVQASSVDSLGLSLRGLNGVERRVFGVPDGGLLVAGVGQGVARRAGFKTGDVILMLDGVPVSSASQFRQLELQLPHDRPVPVLVQRPDGTLFLALSVAHRP
jgi:serine protease Do